MLALSPNATIRRAGEPTKVVPVKGFFSNEIQYYQVYGGDEYQGESDG